VRGKDAVDVLGANAKCVIAVKEPVGGGETADDDDVLMNFRGNGGGDLGQRLLRRDFLGLRLHDFAGRVDSR
jgi:hypothetical protein